MKSQEYFFHLSSQKNLNRIVKSNILTSGKFISQKILSVMNQFQKVTTEYKGYKLTKEISERTLGPGCYPTPQPPSGKTYTFNKSPRFDQDSFTHNMSSDALLKTKQNSICPKLPRATILDKNKEKIKEQINRETKKILQSEKHEKLLKSLKEKVQKVEYRKNTIFKDMLCKKFCLVFVQISVIQSLRARFYKVSRRRSASKAVLRKLTNLCRALGKFQIAAKRHRKEKAITRIKSLIHTSIRSWMNTHTEKLKQLLSDSFNKYFMIILMKTFKQSLVKSCNLLQTHTRNFLAVLSARRKVLDLFWVKLNQFKVLAPPHIRSHYINGYIIERLKRHYYERFQEKKLIYLLNERRHEEFIDEAYHAKGKKKPFLRIFIEEEMLEVIRKANSAIAIWDTIRPEKTKKRSRPKRKAKKRLTNKPSLVFSPSKELKRKNFERYK